MSAQDSKDSGISRRRFIKLSGGMVAGTAVLGAHDAAAGALNHSEPIPAHPKMAVLPFRGKHQAGIVTPQQRHTYFAAFDVTTEGKGELISLLRYWTDAAERLTSGQSAEPYDLDASKPAGDSAETYGLSPENLTITFGFGPSLFVSSDGKDRFGIAKLRPAELIDLPRFNGDQLVPEQTGGDVSVQACSDDPQVAFHAVRQLSRLAYGSAQLRWTQAGFLPSTPPDQTPRNLMGFKDGTSNVSVKSEEAANKFVWASPNGPKWMRGGSYMVVRRIRVALEHWDRMSLGFQEQTVG